MYYKVFRIILGIFLLVSMTGCMGLSSYDLSGQVEVERKGDGFTYRKIYDFREFGSEASDFIPKNDSAGLFVIDALINLLLGDSKYYISLSDLYPLLGFTKEITVNQDIYTIKVEFREKPPQKVDYLTIVNAQGEEVPLTIIAQENYANGDRVDLKNDSYTWQEGYALVSFVEPISENEYLLQLSYSLEATPDDSEVSVPSVVIEISSHIGNSCYYKGLYPLSKKKTVDVYLLDWNLDGAFTDEDRVWIDYGKKKFLPLNKKFKLGKGKKEKEYIMNLKPVDDEDDKYIINIEKS